MMFHNEAVVQRENEQEPNEKQEVKDQDGQPKSPKLVDWTYNKMELDL